MKRPASKTMPSPRHADSTQLARQWALLRLLSDSPRAYSVLELSAQLSVSKLTITRDLATLERNFGLIEEAEGKQKRRYRLAKGVRELAQVSFGPMELLALYAARDALAPAAGAPFFGDLTAAIAKVRGIVGARQNGAIDALAEVFLPHTRRFVDYGPYSEHIDTLVDATARRLACRVEYRAGGEPKTREHEVDPLRLLFHDGALYLVCRFASHRRLGTLAVHRIADVTLLERHFSPPREDLAAFTRPAFGIFQGGHLESVEVVFAAELAWLAEERIFHPDEQKARLPDGRVRLRLRTAARGEVVSWVLRYGGKVELVKPRSWRADVVRLGAALQSGHGG